MTDWTPRDAMSATQYLKFKAGRWAKVNRMPEWVTNNNPTFTEGSVLSYESDRAYHPKEVWVGNNLKYMMKWESHGFKDLDLVGMYVKIK